MATLQKRKSGCWELQFRDEHHRKQTITLSGRKYKERIALQLKDAVEVLVDKKVNNDPRQDPTVKAWVEHAPPEIQRKLTRLELFNSPLKHTVKELWDKFIDTSGKHGATLETYRQARAKFFRFFKPNEQVGALKKDSMEKWKAFLLDSGDYAVATVAGTISKAKAVFNWAKQQRWITVSPLDGVGRGSYRNEAKDRVITQEEYRQLLQACPCQEWRVIITLARIGGLHPCEIMTLRWQDIDKEKHRLYVHNAKLKRIERLYKRAVPLFEEVLAELDKLRSIPGNEKQEYVINRYTDRENSRLQKPFSQIARKAGVGKIPRPFDNMRASRSTEIHREWGSKIESEWLGHSEKTAFDHYLMVTDDDYAKAAEQKKSA